MDLSKSLPDEKVSLQIAPLIDVVFLLLVYFMVTASLIKKEADIAFLLPANVEPSEPIDLPIEVNIQISSSGGVIVEGRVFDAADRSLDALATQMARLRASAATTGSDLIVTISPEDAVAHHRIVEVMNACSAAKVKNISFNLGS